jgi:hypothetical protein
MSMAVTFNNQAFIDPEVKCAIFIDYDNLLPTQKTAGILDVTTRALFQIPFNSNTSRVKCEVRVYGGWYEGTIITHRAQEVSVELQRDFPFIIRLSLGGVNNCIVSINAELAVALIEEPGHHLFSTYRRKCKPCNIRLETPESVGCVDPECALISMKKLLKTGKCPRAGCMITADDLVFREEQKIVDTMLTCDLIYAASDGVSHIALVSGDDDFLPPLRTVLLRGTPATRIHPKPNCPRATFPQSGATFMERDL